MIQYFNLLSDKEVSKFEDFVNSPYFNNIKNISNLFRYLKSLYPNIGENDINNKQINKIIYKNKKFDDAKIRKLKSDFKKVFEKFLIQTEFESEEHESHIFLLKALRKKNLRKEFEHSLIEIKKNTENKKIFSKDDNYYLEQIFLNTEEFNNYINIKKYNLKKLLQNKSDNLDFLFAFMKLHNFHEMLLYEYDSGNNADFNKRYLKEILEFINQNKNSIALNHPNLYIIYLVYLIQSNSGDDYIKKLIDYLKLNEKIFSKTQLAYYYRYLTSYYWTKINEGKLEFRENVFKIYKLMLKKNIYVLENYLNDTEFNNVINAALPIVKYKWMDKFIEKHKTFLKSDISEETYNLAKAKLFFYNKEYNKTLIHLNEVHFIDSHYFINSKQLIARTLFELKKYDVISYVLIQLNAYINRNKNTINNQLVKSVLTFNKLFRSLLKIIENKNEEEIYLLKKELDREKTFVTGKNWFIQKLNEL